MNKADEYFKENYKNIIENGYKYELPRPKYLDGTPAYTYSVNQITRKYDLSKGEYPIMTLRPQAWKSAIKEILWIFQDQSNDLTMLHDQYNIKYWDDWDIGDGTIGTRYGKTISTHYNITEFVSNIKKDPFGRRHIIDLWQVDDFRTPGLKPCAFLTMWNVRKSKDGLYYIDMTLVQRSGDMCAASGAGGINEIQYCALMLMICKCTDFLPGVFCHFIQNEQIYDRHLENAKTMSERDSIYQPILTLDTGNTDFYNFTISDFNIDGYDKIKNYNHQLKFDLGV